MVNWYNRILPLGNNAERGMFMSSKGILEGLRVIDASTVLAAPLIASLLGDFGAEVIKVEQPILGDQTRKMSSKTWKVTGRNKKSVTLDFHKEGAAEIYYDLVSTADVVVTNFRPGTLKKWGIDYPDLVKVKENLVMVHFSAFGRSGPYSDYPGFARVAESFSGLTYMSGYPDRKPIFAGYPIADAMGGVYGAFSVMLALYHYQNTGEGQLIDLSLYEPLVRTMENYIVDYGLEGKIRVREGTHNAGVAPNDIYTTKDDNWIVIPASSQQMYERLMRAIGQPELIDDPRFLNNDIRIQHRQELDVYINAFFSEHTLDELCDIMLHHEVAYGRVNSVADIFKDPHIKERENIIKAFDYELNRDVDMQGIVPKMSKTPGEVKWAGPPLGKHNEEVYKGILNMSDEQLKKLQADGVI